MGLNRAPLKSSGILSISYLTPSWYISCYQWSCVLCLHIEFYHEDKMFQALISCIAQLSKIAHKRTKNVCQMLLFVTLCFHGKKVVLSNTNKVDMDKCVSRENSPSSDPILGQMLRGSGLEHHRREKCRHQRTHLSM